MVMLDPVAFDDVSTVDEGVFKQAAIWGTVYQVQNSGGSWTSTSATPTPARPDQRWKSTPISPTCWGRTTGDGRLVQHVEFVYQYDEEKQAYYVPVTSSVALLHADGGKITKKDGQRIVTVGYVPTSSN